MKFAKLLHRDVVFLDLPCSTKESAIEFMAKKMCGYYNISYQSELARDVLDREQVKSTGLGNGLAVPHGRTDLVDKLYVLFARSLKGIEWNAPDGQPAHYIFFIIGPSKLAKEYLETLGDISRIMIRHEIRDGIHNAETPDEIINIIRKSGARHKRR